MKRQEIIEEIASNLLRVESVAERMSIARKAMEGIDHTKPFVFASDMKDTVYCLQPRKDKTDDEVYALWRQADVLDDWAWWYYSVKDGVIRTNQDSITNSIRHYLDKRGFRSPKQNDNENDNHD